MYEMLRRWGSSLVKSEVERLIMVRSLNGKWHMYANDMPLLLWSKWCACMHEERLCAAMQNDVKDERWVKIGKKNTT